jgi:hypothetical protein
VFSQNKWETSKTAPMTTLAELNIAQTGHPASRIDTTARVQKEYQKLKEAPLESLH